MKKQINWNTPRVHPIERIQEPGTNRIPELPYSQTIIMDEPVTTYNYSASKGWKPVSTVFGQIQKVVIPLRHAANKGENRHMLEIYLRIFSQLVKHLPKVKIYTPVFSMEEKRELEARVNALKPALNWEPEQVVIWVEDAARVLYFEWAQDHMLPFNSKESTNEIFLLEKIKGRMGSLADILAKKIPFVHSDKGSLEFDGGNILIGHDFALVGYDEVKNTREYKPNSSLNDLQIKELFAQQLKLQPEKIHLIKGPSAFPLKRSHQYQDSRFKHELNLWCGFHQTVFHLDLFISLAGRDAEGNNVLLVANVIPENYSPDHYNWPEEFAPYWINALEVLQEGLDLMAKRLSKDGFKVIRNPLVLTYWDEPKPEQTGHFDRIWFLASYNNVIVERTEKKSQVFLPSYAHRYPDCTEHHYSGDWSNLLEVEKENERIWKSLGYEVHFLGDCIPLARLRGGPHCMIKIIHRK